jgi:hypothetical protein
MGGGGEVDKTAKKISIVLFLCLQLLVGCFSLCAYSIVEQQWSYNCRMEELFGLAN